MNVCVRACASIDFALVWNAKNDIDFLSIHKEKFPFLKTCR